MELEIINTFKIIGENIKNIRTTKGITLEEISLKTGIRKEYLSRIEAGKAYGFRTTQFWSIAEALEVNPHQLVKGL